jgi:uncharacterized protein YbaR (Trm112 family)
LTLDKKLLEILACPIDKGPLYYFEDELLLYNPRLHKVYKIEDEIPIMLVESAQDADQAEHDRLLAKASSNGVELNFSTQE